MNFHRWWWEACFQTIVRQTGNINGENRLFIYPQTRYPKASVDSQRQTGKSFMVLPATSLPWTCVHPDVSRQRRVISKKSCSLKGTVALFLACTHSRNQWPLSGGSESYSATPSVILAGEECKGPELRARLPKWFLTPIYCH